MIKVSPAGGGQGVDLQELQWILTALDRFYVQVGFPENWSHNRAKILEAYLKADTYLGHQN